MVFGAVFYSIISVLIISLISLVGIFTLSINEKKIQKVLIFLVSFSVGALLGDTFIHLLPEAFEQFGFSLTVSLSILGGIIFFFILEKFIHWRHCHVYGTCKTHDGHKHPESVAWMNLVGDAFHNLIDGMLIAGSYMVSIPLGFATTIAVAFHELPQEIGDFGVLLHGGFSRKKALFFNFLTALTALVGVAISLIIGSSFENYLEIIIPFTAGGFIYIAGSDLIPELHKEIKIKNSLGQLFAMILGIIVMVSLLMIG
jgi:zinc and cadmium transporter